MTDMSDHHRCIVKYVVKSLHLYVSMISGDALVRRELKELCDI